MIFSFPPPKFFISHKFLNCIHQLIFFDIFQQPFFCFISLIVCKDRNLFEYQPLISLLLYSNSRCSRCRGQWRHCGGRHEGGPSIHRNPGQGFRSIPDLDASSEQQIKCECGSLTRNQIKCVSLFTPGYEIGGWILAPLSLPQRSQNTVQDHGIKLIMLCKSLLLLMM